MENQFKTKANRPFTHGPNPSLAVELLPRDNPPGLEWLRGRLRSMYDARPVPYGDITGAACTMLRSLVSRVAMIRANADALCIMGNAVRLTLNVPVHAGGMRIRPDDEDIIAEWVAHADALTADTSYLATPLAMDARWVGKIAELLGDYEIRTRGTVNHHAVARCAALLERATSQASLLINDACYEEGRLSRHYHAQSVHDMLNPDSLPNRAGMGGKSSAHSRRLSNFEPANSKRACRPIPCDWDAPVDVRQVANQASLNLPDPKDWSQPNATFAMGYNRPSDRLQHALDLNAKRGAAANGDDYGDEPHA